ncbi:NADPH:quinone oxidoreductase family protein [Profundibacterium mesophilum]|uniref:Alcohol dehydrogenase n=1 Tax=Profundibacterium mesophilum KAUST100406-0324 TaxID=1037889 RepID=A0A921NN79_9RHOB|nr:NADPH:quinone oxidoreductase family protein [Profundibacterium mesophilum]KAF0674601.1 alcohol dehydrogenase [Profundibacterium mesophilum KAUST100406-0324]
MRAVLCESFGPPETLVLREIDDPQPGPGEVQIAIEACGVNFPDTLIIEGKYQFRPDPPFIPGGEVSGTVAKLGAGVEGVAIGQKVMAMSLHGGFAQKIVMPADALLHRPEGMPGEIAAGFTMTYGTSMHALRQRADLQPGETLLVLGAGGGVGLAAVEIGKAMGATVIAAASSAEKLAAAQKAGADHLVDYAADDLRGRIAQICGKKGVDVVYDPVGGPVFEQALRSTAWRGRVLVVGFASGDIPKVPANLALLKGCAIVGVFWGDFRRRETALDNANFDQLFAWYAEGRLHPHVSRALPLAQAGEALTALAERRAVGKIVLTAGA